MLNNQREKLSSSPSQENSTFSVPSISLPKGGGAIRGIGEKFAANPVTGTGSMSVPIATSPGRSGFGPQLHLAYDSGSGNGPFGFGWSLSIPSITRKTDKGLPKYRDGEDSDVFILSGAEDLVPVLVEVDGQWQPEILPSRLLNGKEYLIRRYRPRIEGLFARIERWTNRSDPQDSFWRSISKDNITTWYGRTAESRIFDPDNPTHIFSWLICQSYDDKGNAMIYAYAEENADNVDQTQANERNRLRTANRYLKRIKYGNRQSNLNDHAQAGNPTQLPDDTWMFEVVFDYGEDSYTEEAPDPDKRIFAQASIDPPAGSSWPVRKDPFSSYRAAFEVRTYRLCCRTLMFHHFPQELGIEDYLVRSTEFSYEESPVASFITSVTLSGYLHQPTQGQPNRYLKKSLPPVEFEYSKVPGPEKLAQQPILEIDPQSLENLPSGLDGAFYQWMDLDGEGMNGILTEQGGGWYYKRNLSANNIVQDDGHEQTVARLGPMELVAKKPNNSLTTNAQFLDLAGDGQVDLVQMDGSLPGFYERTEDAAWEPFTPFVSRLEIDVHNPNLRFVDLTGDGHADILITEGETLTWHLSLAEDGFGSAVRVYLPLDEEQGPRLVFADSEQSVYLADLSGDGLSDLVRIRNGGVCYWPNLGYGHFGAKVTMDHAPHFDSQDQFEQRRIRLVDTDGSGTTDILYLHRDGVRIYFNQSGNSWSDAAALPQFPPVDSISSIQAFDLLGNGTACLVWSSALPGAAGHQMRYITLMEKKPHLLVKTKNNLGAETEVKYAPSTKFYLQDKQDGQPWMTRLPFPVHVVEKVTLTDKWRHTTFSSTYSYHHGYFDGIEREFRGFGRVDQVDSESYGKFSAGNTDSPYITLDQTLYQPSVKTVTWYHTGAESDPGHILKQFEHEYFPHWFEDMRPDEVNVLGDFQENSLPEPDLDAEALTADEWRESLRACKGMPLRQEIYELNVDALENGEERPVKLFSTAYHNCYIRVLQPRGQNEHAVFLVAESEAITYHYELDLTQETVCPDPRIAHTLNLEHDEYGNVLQSVAVVYPRIGQFSDETLPADSLALIRQVQQERHLAYTETRYTADYDPTDSDNYRLRVPCEVRTYELTAINPEDAGDLASPDPRDNFYFAIDELRSLHVSGDSVPAIPYQELPNRTTPQKRLVEHAQMYFFIDDPNNPGALKDRLELGQLGRLGLPYETYKLALTEDLLDAIFTDATGNKLDRPIKGLQSARDLVRDQAVSGYLKDENGRYWICSGRAGFEPDAAQHFYLPEPYTDPFGNTTTLKYDIRDLFIESSTDALGSITSVEGFGFRVLAPRAMKDINGNLSEAYFDVLGLPVAMALKGKGDEADDLEAMNDDIANPQPAELKAFFDMAELDVNQARAWLGNATVRHIYYFGDDELPACACGILREQHAKENPNSPLQVGFEYSDGMGSVIVKKVQAEPEIPTENLRWIASGKVILNNKGKPVKQFEPSFSSPEVGHGYEEPVEIGVTPVMYYDAPGRLIRTELPDGSYSRVEFSPWHVTSYDPNDTAYDPDLSKCSDWYRRRMDPAHPGYAEFNTPENVRAAKSIEIHANTPALTILDSLGRDVVSIAHNRFRNPDVTIVDEKYLTFTKLDAEGKPLWIRDARKNLVMQYISPPVANNQSTDPVDGFVPCYDIAGNLLYQHSMDAGDRWVLNDASGKPMFSWDSRGHILRTEYDHLHRPTDAFVKGADPADINREIQYEKIIYGEGQSLNGKSDQDLNLRGKPYGHYDTAGLVINSGHNIVTDQEEAFDFKGNLLRSSRQLISDYKTTPDWSQSPALENEIFRVSTIYDALNRPITSTSPDGSIYRPTYNEANLLEKIDVHLPGNAQATPFVRNIDYNAKGQRIIIEYNETEHPVLTTYDYDPETFRLSHLNTTRPLHPESDKRKLQDLSYTYDPVGNITHIADQAQPRAFFDNDCIDASNDYLYDALYRLIGAHGREHKGQDLQPDWDDSPRMGNPIPYNCSEMQNYVELYRYDAVGNILKMEHHGGSNIDSPGQIIWNRRYQYALDSNCLLATSVPSDLPDLPDYTDSPGYHALYRYDEHGNMTSMPHLSIMTWDFKDQFQSAGLLDGGTAYYVYDASGQRVRKIIHNQNGNMVKERIYLGGFEIYRQYNAATGAIDLERETLHIMDDKQRVALIETRTVDTASSDSAPRQLVRFQFGNHLGSTSLELDAEAQIISYEEYSPYGSTAYQAMRSQNETPNRYRYTGNERDEESGLNYHAARYYASWLGKWVSSDPIGIQGGMNLYVYSNNSPIINRDINGKSPSSPPDKRLVTVKDILDLLNLDNPPRYPALEPNSPKTPSLIQMIWKTAVIRGRALLLAGQLNAGEVDPAAESVAKTVAEITNKPRPVKEVRPPGGAPPDDRPLTIDDLHATRDVGKFEPPDKRYLNIRDLVVNQDLGKAEPFEPTKNAGGGGTPEGTTGSRGGGSFGRSLPGGVMMGAMILGSIPGVKLLVHQIRTGDVTGAAKTGGLLAAPFAAARLLGSGPAAILTSTVGAGLKYWGPEHGEITNIAFIEGARVEHGLPKFVDWMGSSWPDRREWGAIYSAKVAVEQSTGRFIVDTGKGIGEGAATLWHLVF